MDRIHKIVYINLDHRPDRRAEVEGELASVGLSGERFPAILRKPGIVGCGLSHIGVLEKAKEEGWENVLILEDDFYFVVDKETVTREISAFFALEIPYDVVMLSYGYDVSAPFNNVVDRAVNAQTASGYLVHRSFYDTLLHNLKEGSAQLIATGRHWDYANDQYWKRLQPITNWYCFKTRLGKQRPSYSDISEKFVHYGNC
jgi:hypothetical protein